LSKRDGCFRCTISLIFGDVCFFPSAPQTHVSLWTWSFLRLPFFSNIPSAEERKVFLRRPESPCYVHNLRPCTVDLQTRPGQASPRAAVFEPCGPAIPWYGRWRSSRFRRTILFVHRPRSPGGLLPPPASVPYFFPKRWIQVFLTRAGAALPFCHVTVSWSGAGAGRVSLSFADGNFWVPPRRNMKGCSCGASLLLRGGWPSAVFGLGFTVNEVVSSATF